MCLPNVSIQGVKPQKVPGSPGSDSSHRHHIHMDTLDPARSYRICQWAAANHVGVSIVTPLPRLRPRFIN